jgi:alpha-1,2-mannosyltransferase
MSRVKRKLAFYFLLLAGFSTLAGRTVANTLGTGADFRGYYAAESAFLARNNPYMITDIMKLIYPPGSLVVMSPITMFSRDVSSIVWYCLSLICLWLTVWIFSRGIPVILRLAACMAAVSFFPVQMSLGMGQVNLILLGLISLLYVSLNNSHPTLVGIIIGIMGAVKLSPLGLLMIPILEKKWKAVWWGLGVFLALNIVGLWWMKDGWGDYLSILWGTFGNKSEYYFNQAPMAMINRMLSDTVDVALGRLFGIVVSVWGFGTMKNSDTKKKFMLAITLMVVLSPVAWQHHMVWLIPMLLWGVIGSISHKKCILLALWMLVVVLLGMNIKTPAVWPVNSLIYNHGAIGLLLLLGLIKKAS